MTESGPAGTRTRELRERDDNRLPHELALRAQGFVPLTAHDAPYSHFATLLPACRIEQVVPGRRHGRVVWSHPGRSGLDPRAVAPLAIVRVADGIGPYPLDPPMALDEAARWLLDGGIEPWLTRVEHRIVVRFQDVTCVYQSDGRCGRCLTHPLSEPRLQQVADALGDATYRTCRPRRWTEPHCVLWEEDSDREHDRAGLARCALAATHRLGKAYRDGLSGSAAWELARGGAVQPAREVPLQLPPPPQPDPDRGVGGFARWKIACHHLERDRQMVHCCFCGIRDDNSPRRTCRQERRTTPLPMEWRRYDEFAELHDSYCPTAPLSAMTCGNAICRTPLALSATGAEGMHR